MLEYSFFNNEGDEAGETVAWPAPGSSVGLNLAVLTSISHAHPGL